MSTLKPQSNRQLYSNAVIGTRPVPSALYQIGNLWYKFAQKRDIPLKQFLQIWHGGGHHWSAPSRQISSLWL